MQFSQSVTVVIVTHQSEGVLAQAVGALANAEEVAEIIVVDNASTDGTCTLPILQHTKVRCLPQSQNLGFGRANNVGIMAAKTPYVLLLNPDAVLDEANLLRGLITLSADAQIAILAPALLDEHGKMQESFKRDVFARERRKDVYTPPEGALCADYLSGAIWLARTQALQNLGGFDEKIFLFYEDDDLCLRARAAGYSLVFEPASRATHGKGKSSGNNPQIDALKQYHQTYSRVYMELKYHGEDAAQSLARSWRLRFFMKWLFATLTCSRKRARYAARLRGVLAAKELLA